jgi:hypothetical protein
MDAPLQFVDIAELRRTIGALEEAYAAINAALNRASMPPGWRTGTV